MLPLGTWLLSKETMVEACQISDLTPSSWQGKIGKEVTDNRIVGFVVFQKALTYIWEPYGNYKSQHAVHPGLLDKWHNGGWRRWEAGAAILAAVQPGKRVEWSSAMSKRVLIVPSIPCHIAHQCWVTGIWLYKSAGIKPQLHLWQIIHAQHPEQSSEINNGTVENA